MNRRDVEAFDGYLEAPERDALHFKLRALLAEMGPSDLEPVPPPPAGWEDRLMARLAAEFPAERATDSQEAP